MFNQVFYLSMKNKKNAAKIGEKRRKKALHIRISRFKPNTGTLSKPKTAIPKRVFGYPNTIRLTFNSLLVMIGDGEQFSFFLIISNVLANGKVKSPLIIGTHGVPTWYMSKFLHRHNFRPKNLHCKGANFATLFNHVFVIALFNPSSIWH